MARVYHVFQSRERLWTRCGERVKSYADKLTRVDASDPALWRHGAAFSDVVICVHCARRLRSPHA